MFVSLGSVVDPSWSEWVKYGIEGVIFLVGIVLLTVLFHITKKGQDTFQDQMLQRQQAHDDLLEKRQKEQDERAKQQDERLTAAIEAILKNQTHAHTEAEERSSSKFSDFVSLELSKLVKHTRCSRAYFIIYHNGAWSNNGISLPKMSIINEAVGAYGVESIMPQIQSIPRTFLPSLDKAFADNGHVFCKDLESLREKDPMTYSWFSSHGCRSVIMYPVKDISREYNIGFVVVEYAEAIPGDLTDRSVKVSTAKVADGIAAAACFTNEDEKLASGNKN